LTPINDGSRHSRRRDLVVRVHFGQ